MSCSFTCWSSLPAELRLAIIDHVDPTTLLSLSATSKITRTQCVRRLFKSITIACFPALQDFVACMPPSHLSHVRELNISTSDAPQSSQRCAPSNAHTGKGTPRSDTLARLLSGTPLLERLDLRLSGGLAPTVVPCFSALQRLTTLSVENCDDEDECPLSETVVVGMALAAPKLSSLSLARITRSRQYAGDIFPTSSYAASIPLVCNDELIPADQQPLSLPSLLTIPTLRHLAIHDTHLGDARFVSADLDVRCALESLEIGTYAGSPPSEGASWTARILERVAPDLKHLACGAGLPDIPPPFPFPSPAALHLPRLRSVRFTPFMSPLMIPSTLSSIAAAGSTVEDLDVECLQDDIEDVVDELLTFVNDATAAGSCPFNHVRLHVREDLDSSPRAPIANAAALDEDCSRSVRKLGGACDRAGVRVSLLGAELDPAVIQAASDMDWDSDDTAVDGHVGDELDKAAAGRVVDMDVEMLEEDAWARFGGW